MSKELRIKDILLEESPNNQIIDPIINGLIGIFRNGNGSRGVYSYLRSVEALIDQGNTPEEAVEYCDKILRKFDGPIIIDDTGV